MVQVIKNKTEKTVNPEPVRPEVEKIVLPEKKVEIERPPVPEAEKVVPLPPEVAEKPPVAPPPPVPSPPLRPRKSETLVKVEKILEEDLEEFYSSMPPEQQRLFKEKGEETASKIEQMIKAGRAIAGKILKLIREWLKLIPGVNRFFLEQEAKIKTDKIMLMAERKKEK